jgi:hypothetical protein
MVKLNELCEAPLNIRGIDNDVALNEYKINPYILMY